MSRERASNRVNWTPDAVRGESAAWRSSWHPPGSEYFVVDDHEFYQQDGEATLLNYRGAPMKPEQVVANAIRIAADHGAHDVLVTIGPGPLAELGNEFLDASGARTVAVIDVLACEIGPDMAGQIAMPPDVGSTRVTDAHGLAAFDRVSTDAWGFRSPVLQDPESAHDDDGEPGLFVASVAGIPVGAGGYSLAGEVARLWGAAVLPEYRGRGVYRGLILDRVLDGRRRGATLALVHAEQTSSPILQRIGFGRFGERRRVRIPTTGSIR
ncbi:GNAT family N-acetyltransferase [Gordonia insulae]|nr:GNAT family N-acetyltransferase [Gordonia insulae]